jgi:hypothetical protein
MQMILKQKNKSQELKLLDEIRQVMVDKFDRARKITSSTQKNLRALQSSKAKPVTSFETKRLKVLKTIGVEQSSYHGGSLNGKDIKKVMNNVSYLFDEFSSILKSGKHSNFELSNNHIDTLCRHFQLVFLLWDGAFSYARTINPTENGVIAYQQFVDAAVIGHVSLGLTITPKAHLMLKHVWWQMENIPGGLDDKREDWVKKQHQMGKQEQARFCMMKSLQQCSGARAWVVHCNSNLVVITQTLKLDGASKRKFKSETRDKEGIESLRERERYTKRFKALDNCNIIKQKNKYALALMGLLFTDTVKPNAEGSTTRGGERCGGSKVMGSLAQLLNDTKWDVGEGKSNTPGDLSVSLSKELSSCEDVTVFGNQSKLVL